MRNGGTEKGLRNVRLASGLFALVSGAVSASKRTHLGLSWFDHAKLESSKDSLGEQLVLLCKQTTMLG